MPPPGAPPRPAIEPPPETATAATVEAGKATFHMYCGTCHGDSAVSTGVLPDLRHSPLLGDSAAFANVVHDGALADRGMVAFGDELSPEDIEKIRAYVIHRANETAPVRSGEAAAKKSE
jgi:alcohol dehydrogenase (cytochrome c)/quinohemoprotein ethanol dehydrogenase